MRGLLPVIAPLASALLINEDVGDVLHVSHLMRALAHFEQRIEPGRTRVGRIKHQAVRELSPPPRRRRPILALDVVNDRRAGPRQQRRQYQADALARARRGNGQDVLGAIVAQTKPAKETQYDATLAQQV